MAIRVGTSVAAPAVLGGAQLGHPYYVAFAAGGGYGGGEPNRKINVLRGNDLEHPTVMEEWSNDAVSLSWGEGPSGHYITLAWTGNDPLRRLNTAVSFDGITFTKDQAWVETCLGGPATVNHYGGTYFAWAGGGGMGGGPPDGSINVLHAGGQKVVLPWKSIAGPAMTSGNMAWNAGTQFVPRLYVAWTDSEGHIFTTWCNHDSLDQLSDPSHLGRVETDGHTEHTFTSPSLACSGNQTYVGWAGGDEAHRVNFKVLDGHDSGRKVTLGETASSSIAMQTYNRGWGDAWIDWGRYAYRGTDGVGGVYVSQPMPF